MTIGGVGSAVSVSQHGIYKFNLSFYDGSQATMLGVCLDNITSKFPQYPLQGKVLNDITKAYRDAEGDARTLPKIPKSVGGGNRLHDLHQVPQVLPKDDIPLPLALTIYESVFENADGGRDVRG